MAGLTGLKVSVNKATPVEDHTTYRYHITCSYNGATWEVAKRFSEFDTLLQSLSVNRYGGLPSMPSKTLLGSPTDIATVEARKEQLRILLNDLLLRPDTRTSQQLRQFLALDSHTDTPIRSLQPDALRTFEDPRFGVSGLCAAPDANLLLVTHEDSTHLSRLGRVWSVVEPDELGALHLWSKGSDGAWKRIHSRTYGNKVSALTWEGTTRQFFVGLEDGKIEVYGLPEDALAPVSIATLELHHKSPVTFLTASPNRVFSLGFDTAMRVIDIRTRELRCGGRLVKRLKNESDYLTTGYLDDARDRVIIGTSGGDIFFLDVGTNPPGFLHHADVGTPVASICVAQETLLVAHGDCVSVFSFEGKTRESRMQKLRTHKSKFLYSGEADIMCVTSSPDCRLLFAGFTDGSVAVWTSTESEAFVVIKAHSDSASKVCWLDGPSWGPALLTGGGDGKVITWSLARNEGESTPWMPESSADAAFAGIGEDLAFRPISSSSDTLAAFEPNFGAPTGGSDMFGSQFGMSNPRVNPQALKRDDESDSDDDIGNAFH